MLGDEVLRRRERRRSAATSRCTRSRRSRTARSSTPRSCGRAGARAACSAATASTGWPTSTSRPELAVKLAMAYGTSLRKGDTVVTSRDSSRSARMLKRAIMAGLNAAGRQRARPRGGVSVPVTRFLVALAPGRSAASRCGCATTTRRAWSSASSTPTGADITEDAQRKIERLFQREDYRRVAARGDRRHRLPAPRPRGLHGRARGHDRRARPIAERRFKLVVDYALRRGVVRDAERARRSCGADVLAVNPYASTAGRARASTATAAARAGRRPGAGLGRPPRRGDRPRRRAPARSSTTRATC